MTNPNPTPSTLGGEGQSQSHRDRQSNRLSEGEVEEAIRLAEIGEYLYDRAYSHGDGYSEPREYGIHWDWQQSKPNEYGQGVLLAEAVAWHEEMKAEGVETEAYKLRRLIAPSPQRPLPDEGVREKVELLVYAATTGVDDPADAHALLRKTRRIAADAPAGACASAMRSLDRATDAILALLPDQPPARPGDREMVEGLRAKLDAVPVLPTYVSEFERGTDGVDRVIMGRDGYMIARLMGRSAAEHEALAELIIEAISALPRLLDLSSRPDEGRSVPEGWSKVREIVDLFFERWGASKSERWEALSGDLPFNADVAMDLIHDAMPAPTPPPYETGGEG